MRFIVAVLLLALLVGVAAGQTLTPLKAGTVVSFDSKVTVDKNTITFGDLDNKLYVTSGMQEDGVTINPVERIQTGDTKPIGMKEISLNPAAETDFQFIDGKRLKETIVIYKFTDLKFPITLAPDTELVKIGAEYRIVAKGAYDPSNWQHGGIPKSIIIEKPYGTDAAGNHVEMDYVYDGAALRLVYKDEAMLLGKDGNITDERTPIVYPLTIDPTYWLSDYQSYLVASLKFNTSTMTYDDVGTVTWTNTGLAQNTSVKKFGASSATVGLGLHTNNLHGNSNAATTFGTGSFTIVGWLYSSNASSNGMLYDSRTTANGPYVTLNLQAPGRILYLANSAVKIQSPDGAVPTNTWNQYALIRNATNSSTSLYVNGSFMGIYTADATNYAQGASTAPYIGNSYFSSGVTSLYSLQGNLDDIAVWKGVAIPIGELYPQYYGVNEQMNWKDDSNTVSLLHFDGTFGSDVFTDASGKIWTKSSSPTTTTESYVFAPAAGNFTSGSITTPQVSDFNVGSGDFTIDFWYNQRNQNFPTSSTLFRTNLSGDLPGVLLYLTPNDLAAFASEEGGPNGNWAVLNDFSMGVVPANGWVHYALVRQGSTFYSFKNGSLVATTASSKTISGAASTASVSLGTTGLNGTVDEFRFTKGFARWTSAFTPPTYAYAVTNPTFTKTLTGSEYSYPVVYIFNSTTLDASWTNISCNWTLTSGGSTYYYNGCDQSVSFGSAGTKTMKLTTNNTNTTSDSPIQSWTLGVPSASFYGTPTTGTAALLVQFNNTVENLTPITSYNWSFGDGYYSDIANPQHVYGSWGVYDVNFTATSAQGSDFELKTSYIVTSTEQNQNYNAPYANEVTFKVIDAVTGEPVPNVNVVATMSNSTAWGTNWLSTLVGIPPDATDVSTTTQYGTTDDDGTVVFTMIAAGRYAMSFTNATLGVNTMKMVYPSSSTYIVPVSTTAHPKLSDIAAMSDDIGINLTAAASGSNILLNMSYVDSGAQTTNVNFSVWFSNQTLVYAKDYPSIGGSNQSVTVSYAVANTRGEAYVWGVSATNSEYGIVNQSQGVTMKGADGMLFNPFVYKDRW